MTAVLGAAVLASAGCSHRPAPAPASCVVRPGANAGWRPVLVFSELNPWLDVIDSDVPTVVAYASGEIITARKELRRARVSVEEIERLLASLRLPELGRLPETLRTSYATDMSTTVIAWRDGEAWRSRSVYGPVVRDPKAEGYIHNTHPAPEPFVSAVETLEKLEPAGATPWTAEVMELMVDTFDHSRRDPVRWPSNWPGFDSLEAVAPSAQKVGRIYLDGSCWEQALEFRKGLGAETPVLLDGRTYRVVGVRPVLPAESEWLRSLPSSH